MKIEMQERSVWDVLRETKKPILLYGMGNGADKMIETASQKGIDIAGVFASDGFVRGQDYHGWSVVTYGQAKERHGDMVVLVAFGTQRADVIANIEWIGREQELYAPDVAVCGGQPFEWNNAHGEKAEQVYELLEDAQSRQVFLSILNYKVSGKIHYLRGCETDMEEAYTGILRLSDDEIYVDAGAYTGDTVREFLRYASDYKKIVAVEPDVRNYAKLVRSAEGMRDVHCLHAAVGEEPGEARFSGLAGRQSALSVEGCPVRCCSIDEVAPDASYIKLDVEGGEREALAGAARTIRTCKPKLLVSAYHRNEDILEIPLQVWNIRKDYKTYLRHYRYIPAWDTNYYFV